MIKNLLSEDESEPVRESPAPPSKNGGVLGLFDEAGAIDRTPAAREFMPPAEPESMAETARRSGLAYSAGIAFFAAVVFMLILGWGADVLLGTSPWGIVAGIVLGSVIGFIQFFRITSQIFKK